MVYACPMISFMDRQGVLPLSYTAHPRLFILGQSFTKLHKLTLNLHASEVAVIISLWLQTQTFRSFKAKRRIYNFISYFFVAMIKIPWLIEEFVLASGSRGES